MVQKLLNEHLPLSRCQNEVTQSLRRSI